MANSQQPSRRSRVYGALRGGVARKWFRRPADLSWGRIFSYIGVAVGVLTIVGAILVLIVSRDLPDPNKLGDRQVAQSTKIYDRTGEHLLYEVFQNQKRTVVDLAHISEWIPKAFVAVEDKHFYEHKGVRLLSIMRAGFNNLIGRRSGSGGASTLTQQLVKNAIVGDERRGFAGYFRKFKEAILALQLEKKYSKDEIMKMYLNEIPLGSTNYGVEAASQSYFHKPSKELTLAESATLAALNQAPTRYLNNTEALRGRRDLVLGLMAEQGAITAEQKKEAQNVALRIYRNKGIFNAPHFVDYVREQLVNQFGEKVIDTGGLKVITTLDFDKQQKAEKIIKEQGEKFAKTADANNAALVAIDPKTAQIWAMVGSRDYYNDEINGQYNVAVQSKIRQPGSSFKPFVYLAAFEKGYTPETVLYDVKTDFDARDGETYSPQNYDHKEHGLMSMRGALQNSLNIPAVKAMYLVGEQETFAFAKRFGYSTFKGNEGLSLVLGGGGVNLLEHTNAYATLADNGVFHPSVSILKVTNANGDTMFEWQPTDGAEAVKPELAALMSSVLSDNEARAMVFGIKNNLTLPDRAVAAKTGTTNDSKDAWTMGYVPSLAAGVWVGNTEPKPMKGGGNLLAGVIWNQFMRQALASTTPETFDEPPKNDAMKPVLTGSDGGIKLMINTVTGRIATSSTPENLMVERTFLPPHDILHYVIKDDPRGPVPEHPEDDSQYLPWEQALYDWVNREQNAGRDVSLAEPPTLYDTPQSAELAPRVQVLNPTPGTVFRNRDLSFTAQAGAPRGISQVVYYIDGERVGTSNQPPFSVNYHAQRLSNGPHLLKAVAEDDQGNAGTQEVPFMMQAEFDPPSFDWVEVTPLTVSGEEFPRNFFINPFRWEEIQDIKVYWVNGSSEKLIYTFNHQDQVLAGKLSFTWKTNPGSGHHVLRAVMTDKQSRTLEKQIEVIVQ